MIEMIFVYNWFRGFSLESHRNHFHFILHWEEFRTNCFHLLHANYRSVSESCSWSFDSQSRFRIEQFDLILNYYIYQVRRLLFLSARRVIYSLIISFWILIWAQTQWLARWTVNPTSFVLTNIIFPFGENRAVCGCCISDQWVFVNHSEWSSMV